MKRIAFAGFPVLIVCSCSWLNYDLYVPNVEELKYWIPYLYDPAYSYAGISANHDVDSFIFAIRKKPGEEGSDFFSFADKVLPEEGWVRERKGLYHRLRGSASCALIRTATVEGTDITVLGFVEGSCSGPFTYDHISTGGEFRWAKREFWPRFEKTLMSLKGRSED
jgi:hypothetical protein